MTEIETDRSIIKCIQFFHEYTKVFGENSYE